MKFPAEMLVSFTVEACQLVNYVDGMQLSGLDQQHFDEFANDIESVIGAYSNSSFSYFAVKVGDSFELIQGRIMLGVRRGVKTGHYESESIKAGLFMLSDVNETAISFAKKLLSGSVSTPQGELQFVPEREQSFSLYYNPFYQINTEAQIRQKQLYIRGHRNPGVDNLKFDWEVRAAAQPFDGLSDLCNEFGIGKISNESTNVELIAFSVAAIAAESSVAGTKATLIMHLAHGLDPKKAAIGFRIIDKGVLAKRGRFASEALSWSALETFQRAEISLDVPIGSLVQCFATFADEVQQFWWISDPSTAPNHLRAVHLAFDPNLAAIEEVLLNPPLKKHNSRDLEIAVCWLTWMMGFSVTPVGVGSKTSDSPDLIAVAPNGNYAVIECTTGLLKGDNKLSNLVGRTEIVRQALKKSGNPYLHVLSLLVTTRSRDEIKADLEQATKLGVLVVAREELQELLQRTLRIADANEVFAEAETSLRQLQSPNPFLPRL